MPPYPIPAGNMKTKCSQAGVVELKVAIDPQPINEKAYDDNKSQ